MKKLLTKKLQLWVEKAWHAARSAQRAALLRISLIKGRTIPVPPLKLFFRPSFDPTKTGLFWPIYFRPAIDFLSFMGYI